MTLCAVSSFGFWFSVFLGRWSLVGHLSGWWGSEGCEAVIHSGGFMPGSAGAVASPGSDGGGSPFMSTGRAIRRERDRSIADATAVHIRWMIRRDMPDVMVTERASFEYAWTEDDFLRCLRQRNCIGMVAERGDSVIGFMIYELHRTRLHLLNFAVHPAVRRTGIGAMM